MDRYRRYRAATQRQYAHHYVYVVRWQFSFYIGVRSCDCDPEDDTKYLGTGIFPLFRASRFGTPTKTVLFEYGSRAEADRAESLLIVKAFGRSGCMNRRRTKCHKFSHVQ